jgi:glutamyl-tRNA reductase
MSELLTIGISHKTAPVEIRERLALPEGRALEFVRELRGDADVQEAVVISTCNRTELYRRNSPPRSTPTATATLRAICIG